MTLFYVVRGFIYRQIARIFWVLSPKPVKKYMVMLFERALFTEVGFLSGHVSDLDRALAKEKGLKQLNCFELWFLSPWIRVQKELRQQVFRQAVFEVIGEDPNDW